MRYAAQKLNPATESTHCIIMGVYENHTLTPTGTQCDKASKGYIKKVLRRGDLEAKPGQTLLLHDVDGIKSPRVLLVGCGNKKELNDTNFDKIISGAQQVIKHMKDAINCLVEVEVKGRDSQFKSRQIVLTSEACLYQYNALKTKKAPANALKKLTLLATTVTEAKLITAGIKQGTAIGHGMNLAKDLGNHPGNVCTPSYLARQAQNLSRQFSKIKTTILNEQAMAKLKMGALLSVSEGSKEPAKLITLEYKGGKKNQKPIVLVGKGITFDSGGISIKPSSAMDEMKYDMCGAASVFGALKACAEMSLALNVVGVIAASENLPGGNATKPGDVVKSMSGQTIEILNTDAEGRLVLSDALTYCKRFDPDVVIDIATLTGAMVVALGPYPTGFFSNNETLAKDLEKASHHSNDRLWRLPLWDDYQSNLDSNFADMANIGGKGGGSITAACFLSRFAKHYHWAHLDIAGTAWLSGPNKGATGRPVPLLTQYLLDKVGV